MGELDIGPRPATLLPKDELVGVMTQDMEVGLKRPTTRTCSMLEKLLMVLGEVDLGLGTDLLPTIIQVIMLDHLVFIFTVITEVDIGIPPENFPHITMVD